MPISFDFFPCESHNRILTPYLSEGTVTSPYAATLQAPRHGHTSCVSFFQIQVFLSNKVSDRWAVFGEGLAICLGREGKESSNSPPAPGDAGKSWSMISKGASQSIFKLMSYFSNFPPSLRIAQGPEMHRLVLLNGYFC